MSLSQFAGRFGAVLLSVFVFCSVAKADAIVGIWEGTWDQGGGAGGGTVVMTITDQTPSSPADALTGFFEWVCTFGVVCSGTEFFSGTLTGSFFDVTGTSLSQASANLGLGRYTGTVSADGNSIVGDLMFPASLESIGTWSVRRVSQIPEPVSMALLALAVGIMTVVVRNRRPQ